VILVLFEPLSSYKPFKLV